MPFENVIEELFNGTQDGKFRIRVIICTSEG
jgi:hypothetical protein